MTERKSTFSDWQESRVSSREQVIKSFLAVLRRTRTSYKYVTDLAAVVANQITLTEGNPCSTSTLLRNKRYKALLLNFMANIPGAQSIERNTITDPKAKAVVAALELESANLKSDNDRLKLYIQGLQQQLSDRPLPVSLSEKASEHPDDSGVEIHQLHVSLGLACKSLWLIVSHFDKVLVADMEGERLLDLSAPRNRQVVVDAKTARPFFEWLRINGEIAGIKEAK